MATDPERRRTAVRSSIVFMTVLVTACAWSGPVSAPVAVPVAVPVVVPPPAANARLDSLAEAYYEEFLAVNPVVATANGDSRYDHLYIASFAESQREAARSRAERYLGSLSPIDRNELDAAHQLTLDVFRWNLESIVWGHEHPSHLVPLNQFFNFTASFAQMGSGRGVHPFRTEKNYDDFLSRIAGFTAALDTAIANMRRGMTTGIVQPRVLMERALPQLAAHVLSSPDSSIFYGPVRNMPESFSPQDRARLTAAYEAAIRDQLVPGFARLHDFIRNEYLPAARSTVGLSALPGGLAWYQHLVRMSTTTELTPDQIHAIGLSEVARIHREIDAVRQQVGFAGTVSDFLRHLQTDPRFRYATREEMLADYRAAQARIDPLTDRLFDVKPKADYEIRPVEEFRERSASGGSYQSASPDGSRPGVFYLNTYDPASRARYRMESLLLHEGSPGHHFQISIQRELEHLPRIRRFGGFTAYSEGWGLYAESIGRELGVYTDPYQYYGALAGELWRAIRLVLDTGIHAKGWTRERAIEYARQNSSESDTQIVSEVERFIAIPGQALAYKMGELKIRELRTRAEEALGARFDVKAFHRAILEDGALPLAVLEAKIDRWLERQRS
jgi:uncharacterized protein (DUF885 family)